MLRRTLVPIVIALGLFLPATALASGLLPATAGAHSETANGSVHAPLWASECGLLLGTGDKAVSIAPWPDDEATLGRSRQAFAYLDEQARTGRLVSAFGASDSGMRLVAQLRALLRREGGLR